MSKLYQNVLLLAKIQPAIDTDPVPTAALNAILASNVVFNPIQADFAERNNMQNYLGNQGKILTSQYASISFDVELAGSGAAGTAPKYGPLLRACAMAETTVVSTSVAYNPITTGHEMVTLHFFLDGLKFVFINAKGNVSFKLDARGIPVMSYSFTGSYTAPTDIAVPTGSDFSGFKAPLAINKINTPTFTLHGVVVKTQNLTLDLANQVVYRNMIGTEVILVTDRSPAGSTKFETESVAFKDWWSTIRLGTLAALQLIHGSVAGLIIQIDCPKVQITDPQYDQSDNVSMMGCNFALQPNIGNDEFVLTIK